jgi:alkanesulfonate monooxygenase SsuD/methylene tetrahydromethanopterin reductase-like flavin-dependent oxidoreductase (luciferase family)
MRVLWDEPTPTFAGRYVSFSGVMERPRPRQRPHPPVVCGGHSPASLRRAVRQAQGWYGWELSPERTAESLAALRRVAERDGRPAALGELEITITPPPDFDEDMARRYADLGVHRLVLQTQTSEGSAVDELIDRASDTLVGRI